MDSLQSDISFTYIELVFIRQCIDLATIQAKDAKSIAALQNKVEEEIQQMQRMQAEVEETKSVKKRQPATIY